MKKSTLCAFAALLLSTGITTAQTSFTQRVVAENLFIPWEIIYGPDGNIWFTQKNGYICKVSPTSGVVDTLYHETNTVVRGEGGMLGMALHPSFPAQPYVYVAYEYMDGSDYTERIVRYTFSSGSLAAPTILLDNIEGSFNHNGARLLIVDDKLFITTGDAENTSLPQNMASLSGKTLRINLDGSIPSDNPNPASAVWSWGHRNAQGLAYNAGKTYSSEHGPSTNDELNLITKGGNYGWPNVHGYCDESSEMDFCADSNVIEPLRAWTPTIATSGIAYYNHPMFPDLQNSILMTTLKDNSLYHLALNTAGDSVTMAISLDGIDLGRLRDIAISPDGKIYLSTSNSPANGEGAKIDKIIELYDPSATGVHEVIADDKNVSIYPNPASDQLFISFAEAGYKNESWQYELISTDGRIVQSGNITNNSIDISNVNAGMYFIKGKSETKIFYKRIVKR